jgi:hypothetical protein
MVESAANSLNTGFELMRGPAIALFDTVLGAVLD